jgi:tight adherence protein C
MEIVLYIMVATTIFGVIVLMMSPVLFKPSPEAQRILDVVTSKRPDKRTIGSKEAAQETILGLARDVRARFGLAENAGIKNRLYQAGMRDSSSADVFFAAQFLTPLVLGFAATFIHTNTIFMVFVGAIVGYMAPDFWLTFRQKKRKEKIRRSMPDAIDLLVICVDAGLGLDQALLRVGQELALSHPEINEEFSQVNLEQRAGKPRLEAWQSLAARNDIEEFQAFVSMLTQSDRFGTPIIRALSRFSEELRQKRSQHAEEAAAKTKVKIIFPLVLCIFPCLFIVLLAPAMMSISSGLQNMGN